MNATEQAREITNQIIAEAKRRNLTVGQLELKWGVTKSYVSVIMRGKRVPHLGTLDRIAKVMGVQDEIKIGQPMKDKAFFDLLSNNREFITAIAPHQHINNGFCWETNNKGEITLDKYCPACVKIQSVTGWDFENTDEEEE